MPLTIGGTRISASSTGMASSPRYESAMARPRCMWRARRFTGADIATAMKVARTIHPIGLRSR